MFTKVLASVAIAFGAAVGVAAPALADPAPQPGPNPFGGITCSDNANCSAGTFVGSRTKTDPVVNPGQMAQAIQQGLTDLQANQAQQ